jgi:hypothetical protein
VPGHDIRWVTKLGDTVLVERKDRSYEAGPGGTPEKRIKRVVAEVRNAAATMPRDPPGAGRVLMVGFQHLVPEREAGDVDRGSTAGLKEAFGGGAVPLDDLPHVVIVEHLGLEPKTGGQKWDFFSPQPLNPEPRFMAAGRRRSGGEAEDLLAGLAARDEEPRLRSAGSSQNASMRSRNSRDHSGHSCCGWST